jgi:cell migration-inducing and hyaluronan-binding protein
VAVELDENAAVRGLTINGVLRFADKDLELRADWIMVHGRLEVGTPERPFRHRAIITLTGNNPSEDQMGMGTKVLGVMGASWSCMANPAKAGPGWLKRHPVRPVRSPCWMRATGAWATASCWPPPITTLSTLHLPRLLD